MEFNPPPFPGAAAPAPEPPKPGRGRRRGGASNDAEHPVTKKVVDRQRRFAIIFAILLAVVAAVVVLGGTTPQTYVVQAKGDIAAGTLVEPKTHFKAVAVPDEFIEKGAITAKSEEAALKIATEDLTGMRVQYPLSAGQQVHPNSFNVELTLSEPLAEDERLMSIEATVANAVAAQVKAGDHVDIAASGEGVSGVVLDNVEVVSATVSESQYQALASQQTGENKDTRAEELLPGAPIPGIYVVRVSAEDAPKLVAVAADARLSLIYRGEKGEPLDSTPMTAKSVICQSNPSMAACRE